MVVTEITAADLATDLVGVVYLIATDPVGFVDLIAAEELGAAAAIELAVCRYPELSQVLWA